MLCACRVLLSGTGICRSRYMSVLVGCCTSLPEQDAVVARQYLNDFETYKKTAK